MRTIQYVGKYDIVVVAATGQEAERGEAIDIEDDELAASLCEQVDNWQAVGWTPELSGPGAAMFIGEKGPEIHVDGTETELVSDDHGDDD